MKYNESHVFTGMQRDMSVSKHPVQFLYDGRNIRLTAREGDSLMSITNEKGTAETDFVISGIYLGHCLLNNYLVVFSTIPADSTINPATIQQDFIIRFDLSDDAETPNPKVLYDSLDDNDNPIGTLGFKVDKPIEAIGSYESEAIQKVYWTDGENQPRVINITADRTKGSYLPTSFDFVGELKLEENVSIKKLIGSAGRFPSGVIQYAFTYYSKYGHETNIFYTSPLLYISPADRGAAPDESVDNAFRITVENLDYNFDYLRIYSILRTSVNGTPIVKRVQDIALDSALPAYISNPYMTSPSDEPEIQQADGSYAKVSTLGLTTVQKELLGSDPTQEWYLLPKSSYSNIVVWLGFGYVTWRESASSDEVMYISKTKFIASGDSTEGYQICSVLNNSRERIRYSAKHPYQYSTIFTDTGSEGDAVDPAELLYKGGENIIAKTIEQKDNTLFLGNLQITRPQINNNTLIANIKNIVITRDKTRSFYLYPNNSTNYPYSNQLTAYSDSGLTENVPCCGFKRGDYYRCGIQFQYKTGKWSDPIFIKDTYILNSPEIDGNTVTVPVLRGTIPSSISNSLISLGYKKARAVVVYPDLQDRVTVCQGISCPTISTDNSSDKLQSSWFFRPYNNDNPANNAVNLSPYNPLTDINEKVPLIYTNKDTDTDGSGNNDSYNPLFIRRVEIQGDYNSQKKFYLDNLCHTFHSPDIEFDSSLSPSIFTGVRLRKSGYVEFSNTLCDISIQTESPTISDKGSGFIHEGYGNSGSGSKGFVSGLFYDDYVVDDINQTTIQKYDTEQSSVKWLVYPWQRTGSLNNDILRNTNLGTQSAVLKKKIISNLRIANTIYTTNSNSISFAVEPQAFLSDQLDIVKLGDKVYQGNIDTMLNPDNKDGMYFAFGDGLVTDLDLSGIKKITDSDITTPFSSNRWWKTYAPDPDAVDNDNGLYVSYTKGTNPILHKWNVETDEIGNAYLNLVAAKDSVRMKYKSSPHLVFEVGNTRMSYINPSVSEKDALAVEELIRIGDNSGDAYYRNSMFGGISDDALKANLWIPCGEPVALDSSHNITYEYSWGDTYFQRYDCLKTYAFSSDDINQVVEIGSFMLETHVNIDGRYDRNRGQIDNTNMSPRNFNLLNPVYSQLNNFFTYRIQDDDFYTNTSFPNQFTWTKEKAAGADTDAWTNITLASTYDMDGSKGEIISINAWKDQLYCFQKKGVSSILFNSRVQIPTSDNNPIEITNSYKVDGCRYLSDGIGSDNKLLIKETPVGIYFIDSVSGGLFHIGESLNNISGKCNLSSLFKSYANQWKRMLYDDVNHDLYLTRETDTALCYSELLQQFTGFMDYDDISLIETCNKHVFTLKGNKMFKMFEGDYYCDFFGTKDGQGVHHPIYKPWGFTFVSNGSGNGTASISKMFTNLEFRACVSGDGVVSSSANAEDTVAKFIPYLPLDSLEVWDEYQHGYAELKNKDGGGQFQHFNSDDTATLKRKFRIWRCDIPRNNYTWLSKPVREDYDSDAAYNEAKAVYDAWLEEETKKGISRYSKKPNDRMKNPWLYLKLWKEKSDSGMFRTEIHDIMTTYFD